jgi:hypothetical protein
MSALPRTAARVGGLVLAALVIGAMIGVAPAAADERTTVVREAEAYVASSLARGLDISLFGEHLTIGASKTLIDSTPKAEAQGAGVLLLGGTVADAAVVGADQSDDPPKACILDLDLGLLGLEAACGDAAVNTPGGLPQAIATGAVAGVDLLGQSILDDLLDPLTELLDQTVGDVLDPLLGILGPLLEPLLGALDLNADSLVSDLLAGIRRASQVLSVRLGPTGATATTDASTVVAEGAADGAVIEVLPGLTPLGAPLLTIRVGAARATVELTRPAPSEGEATVAVAEPSFAAALATVSLGLPLLGPDVTEIPVGLGQPIVLLEGTPLEIRISVGAGSVSDIPNGGKAVMADGVSIQLLTGLNGGIGLSLAHAEAAAAGRSALIEVVEPPPPTPPPPFELARTGASGPWMPLLGAALLMAAYLARRLALARR